MLVNESPRLSHSLESGLQCEEETSLGTLHQETSYSIFPGLRSDLFKTSKLLLFLVAMVREYFANTTINAAKNTRTLLLL